VPAAAPVFEATTSCSLYATAVPVVEPAEFVARELPGVVVLGVVDCVVAVLEPGMPGGDPKAGSAPPIVGKPVEPVVVAAPGVGSTLPVEVTGTAVSAFVLKGEPLGGEPRTGAEVDESAGMVVFAPKVVMLNAGNRLAVGLPLAAEVATPVGRPVAAVAVAPVAKGFTAVVVLAAGVAAVVIAEAMAAGTLDEADDTAPGMVDELAAAEVMADATEVAALAVLLSRWNTFAQSVLHRGEEIGQRINRYADEQNTADRGVHAHLPDSPVARACACAPLAPSSFPRSSADLVEFSCRYLLVASVCSSMSTGTNDRYAYAASGWYMVNAPESVVWLRQPAPPSDGPARARVLVALPAEKGGRQGESKEEHQHDARSRREGEHASK
jgi:hypothetical protein